MYSNNYYYPRYTNLKYNISPSYYPTYIPYTSYDEIVKSETNETESIQNKENTQEINSEDSIVNDNIDENETSQKRQDINEPRNNRLSLFGLSFELDDLILIGLIILLLLESSDNNLVLVIVLGLMLFNINLSSLNLF